MPLASPLGWGQASGRAARWRSIRQGLFLGEDRDAREAAQEVGVRATGTIGILVACVREGYVSPEEGDALLAEMVARGYHSRAASLAQLLAQGERLEDPRL